LVTYFLLLELSLARNKIANIARAVIIASIAKAYADFAPQAG
jgi:hypothetical protein